MDSEWDPDKYHDTHRQKVEALIEAKRQGRRDRHRRRGGAGRTKVVDLMEVLSASIDSVQSSGRQGGAGGQEARPSARPRPRRSRRPPRAARSRPGRPGQVGGPRRPRWRPRRSPLRGARPREALGQTGRQHRLGRRSRRDAVDRREQVALASATRRITSSKVKPERLRVAGVGAGRHLVPGDRGGRPWLVAPPAASTPPPSSWPGGSGSSRSAPCPRGGSCACWTRRARGGPRSRAVGQLVGRRARPVPGPASPAEGT